MCKRFCQVEASGIKKLKRNPVPNREEYSCRGKIRFLPCTLRNVSTEVSIGLPPPVPVVIVLVVNLVPLVYCRWRPRNVNSSVLPQTGHVHSVVITMVLTIGVVTTEVSLGIRTFEGPD